MDDPDLPHEVTLAVVYVDEHLLQIVAAVRAGCWQGRARAYIVPQDIMVAVAAVRRFADGAVGEAEFVAGVDTGIGLFALRFYRIDGAGHIACHVLLASGGVP